MRRLTGIVVVALGIELKLGIRGKGEEAFIYAYLASLRIELYIEPMYWQEVSLLPLEYILTLILFCPDSVSQKA